VQKYIESHAALFLSIAAVLNAGSRQTLHRDFHMFTGHCRYLLLASCAPSQGRVPDSSGLNALSLEDYIFFVVVVNTGYGCRFLSLSGSHWFGGFSIESPQFSANSTAGRAVQGEGKGTV
jgi:hypothetical protein